MSSRDIVMAGMSSPDIYDRYGDVCNRNTALMVERDSLRSRLASSDLERIRLRSGLREALGLLDQAGWQDEDKRTELRGLVTP